MVDMNLLKQLREATFAPLKDCKEALEEANGDLDKAQDALREKGIMKAGKKLDRETNEGIVKVIQKDGRFAGIKLLCETDFVAKNEDFAKLTDTLLEKLLWLQKVIKSVDELDEATAKEMNDMVAAFVGKIGENMKIAEVILDNQKAYVYNHPGNKVASIIYFDGGDDEIAKELALQVAAMNPTYLDFDAVPDDYREKLIAEFKEEMKDSGKPQEMIDKILDGKLKKSLAELVLLEQEYIRDGSKKIKEIIPSEMVIKGYTRMSIR